mgnify:FL=1
MTTISIDQVTLDPEFQTLLDPLTDDAVQTLHAQLQKFGIMDPLKAAEIDGEHVLVDGHNRWLWYQEHGDADNPPPVVVVSDVTTRAAARLWMYEYQLGRRNVTDNQRATYRGKLVRYQYQLDQETLGKDATINKAVATVSKKQQVSPRTMWRGVYLNDAVTVIAEHDPKAAQLIESNKANITQSDVIQLSKEPATAIKAACENLRAGRKWDDAGVRLVSENPETVIKESKKEKLFRQLQITFATLRKTLLPEVRSHLMSVDKAINEKNDFCPFAGSWQSALESIEGQVYAWEPGTRCPVCDLNGCNRCEYRGWLRKRKGV